MLFTEKRSRNSCCSWKRMFYTIILAILTITVVNTGRAEGQPKTVAEIALYQGRDREKILIEGAKKEGQMFLYASNTWVANTVSKAFGDKYPFIKVLVWRSPSGPLVQRIEEEYKANRFTVDTIEISAAFMRMLQSKGLLQEYYTPEAAAYDDNAKYKGEKGLYYLADRENYYSLGFNTKLVPPKEAPKTWQDLLDPRWKGKMSIPGSDIGVTWVGNALDVMGRKYLEEMSKQGLKVQNLSTQALGQLIASGEIPLSPSGGNTSIYQAKQKGAPVDWLPIEPVLTNSGLSGIVTKAPHPHAAMLFLDYIHSKEGQEVCRQGGISSPREDMAETEKKFKKVDMEAKYSLEEFEKKFIEWQDLMQKLFIMGR